MTLFYNHVCVRADLVSSLLRLLRHETELPHFGTYQGMLRHLWRLAESSAHAGRAPWLVLCRLLPGLQGAAASSGDTSDGAGGTPRRRGATGSLKPAAIWAIGALGTARFPYLIGFQAISDWQQACFVIIGSRKPNA
jgi:hypothetical protein